MPEIAIFGASGKTGRSIVNYYIQKNKKDKLLLLGRDQSKTASLFDQDIAFRRFEFEDSSTWQGIFDEVKKIYLMAPYKGTDALFQYMQIIQLAKESGIKKVIFLSGRTTGDIPGSLLNQIENLIIQSGLKYIILRPGWFMQNFANWYKDLIKEEDVIILPAGSGKTAFLDLQNLAQVVFTLFQTRKWDNQIIPLTSEESINHFEVAEILSSVLNREIRYMPLPGEEFIHAMHNRKWNSAFTEKLVYLYQFVKKGKEDDISPRYQEIMGKKPNTFAEFVKRNQDVWN